MRPALRNPLLALAFAVSLAPASLAAPAPPATPPAVPTAVNGDLLLARWKGGELRQSKWQRDYGRPGQAIDLLRQDIWGRVVAKAVFREIYGDYARRNGLESSSLFLGKMEDWRRLRLSQLYRERQAPDFAVGLTDEALHRFHRERAPDLFWSEGRADLVVLYLRCSLRPSDRQVCLERLAGYGRRLAEGVPLATLAEEEKAHSGSANGSFKDVGLKDLNSDLRAAVAGLEAGQRTALVEAPHGLFLAEVEKSWNRGPIPFEKESTSIVRDVYLREKNEAWEMAEVRRLGGRPGARDATLAAAAQAMGLDRESEYLRQEANFRSWALADVGYYHDKEAHPSDAVLAARLAGRRERFETLRLFVFTLPVGEDRRAVFAQAGRLSERLKTAGDGAAALEAAAASEPGGRTATFEVRRDKLARRAPALAKAVAELAAGQALGPVPIESDDFDFAGDEPRSTFHSRADYDFLAFVGVLDRRLPAVDAVRPELLEDDAAEWSRGPAFFIPYFSKRWQIELFPEDHVAP